MGTVTRFLRMARERRNRRDGRKPTSTLGVSSLASWMAYPVSRGNIAGDERPSPWPGPEPRLVAPGNARRGHRRCGEYVPPAGVSLAPHVLSARRVGKAPQRLSTGIITLGMERRAVSKPIPALWRRALAARRAGAGIADHSRVVITGHFGAGVRASQALLGGAVTTLPLRAYTPVFLRC